MPSKQDFYVWEKQVQEMFPKVKSHHRTALAQYSFGLILAKCCGLTTVLAHLARFLACAVGTLKDRLRDLYRESQAQNGSARSELDPTACFGPLLRWAVCGQPQRRVALALDPTSLTDRFQVFCVSVLYQGGGLPVAWVVQKADQKGSWNAIWKQMLTRLHQELPPGFEVLVLTDRGLESAELFRTITTLGWHPLMRVKARGTFRPTGWKKRHKMKYFATSVGRRWAGEGVAYPTEHRLPCTLLAAWEPDHEEAWLILTDLPACGTDVAWYAWRMWCEQGYRTIKRGQWQWHRTQMSDPRRVERLWVVIALASMWAIDVGAEAEAAQLPAIPKEKPEEQKQDKEKKKKKKPKKRKLSLLKQGLTLLLMALINGDPMPMPRQKLQQHAWPQREWQSDDLKEEHMPVEIKRKKVTKC